MRVLSGVAGRLVVVAALAASPVALFGRSAAFASERVDSAQWAKPVAMLPIIQPGPRRPASQRWSTRPKNVEPRGRTAPRTVPDARPRPVARRRSPERFAASAPRGDSTNPSTNASDVVLAGWSPTDLEVRRTDDPEQGLQREARPDSAAAAPPHLNVEILVDSAAAVVGQRTRYRVRVRNFGRGPAENVALTLSSSDELPLLRTPHDRPAARSPHRALLGPIDRLAPGEGAEFEVHAFAATSGDARLVVVADDRTRGVTSGTRRCDAQVLVVDPLDTAR